MGLAARQGAVTEECFYMTTIPDIAHCDTIAALATAAGASGVAIVRISGPTAYAIADRLLPLTPPPSERPARTFSYGPLLNADTGEIVDQVIALFFRAPNSYTCEDVIEIQGHGGHAAAQRLLNSCIEAGARQAEPGEFTKRAFLNGRIDLIQAESIADLIRAESDRSAVAAIEQLRGRLSTKMSALYTQLLSLHADATALLDFDEDEVPQSILSAIPARMQQLQAECRQLLDTWREGILLREGVDVVITGRPNVGKSTLLNALLGSDRAIVSDAPGTTRDTIEESLLIDGIPVRLTDTAGLRDTTCSIESAGIERARQRMQSAHINLHVLDASQPIDSEEQAIIDALPSGATLLFFNKTDIGIATHPPSPHLCIQGSLTHQQGIEALTKGLKELICGSSNAAAPPHAVISERHREALSKVMTHLTEAEQILRQTPDELLLAADHLQRALALIAHLLGKEYSSDLLDRIFSGFCLGK